MPELLPGWVPGLNKNLIENVAAWNPAKAQRRSLLLTKGVHDYDCAALHLHCMPQYRRQSQ